MDLIIITVVVILAGCLGIVGLFLKIETVTAAGFVGAFAVALCGYGLWGVSLSEDLHTVKVPLNKKELNIVYTPSATYLEYKGYQFKNEGIPAELLNNDPAVTCSVEIKTNTYGRKKVSNIMFYKNK